jgi:hypothetical protein
MVRFPLRNLESEMEMKKSQKAGVRRNRSRCFSPTPLYPNTPVPGHPCSPTQKERGQAVVLFALILPIMSIFAVLIMEYMVTTARMMSAVAAADLAAHAGVQEITVDPDGTIRATDKGRQVAGAYFQAQRIEHVTLTNIECGLFQNRPACRVAVQVQTPGYILPKKKVAVNAIGYLAHGVTRGDQ